MIRLFLLILFLCIPFSVVAQELPITLEKAPINPSDMASVKRGAQFFAKVCMACHTAIYLRYNSLAKEAGVTYERMPLNVKQWPFGIKPPDLSLEASYRGVDWIYTYLHSFYQDPARPTGVNNLLVPNTAMAGILVPLQGQLLKTNELVKATGIFDHSFRWYDALVLQQQGSMTQAQFDATITDVVNFLNYAANPYEQEQKHIGLWVIGFLIIMFVLLYTLKKEYWKDIEKHKEE